jgi:uncharacterized membrane protein YfcA
MSELMSQQIPMWILLAICCVLIGMAKAGLSGASMVVVPIMALIFGGKPSTGIVQPLLIVADVCVVPYYHRHANWKYIFRILPWALVGIAAGVLVGNIISDALFKKIIGITIFVGVGIMVWKDVKEQEVIPDYWWFAMILGIFGGFATMIGNAAGPILAIYLLSMRLPKLNYIGTTAWFFFIVNILKVPLHVGIWKTISLNTLLFDVLMTPAIVAGVVVGIKIVKVIPEKPYRILIIVATVLSALMLFK